MTEKELLSLISTISPLDEKAMIEARNRQMSLAKPPRSLGRLEDISIQLSGITGKVKNRVDRKCLVVFASDNGVTDEGVSSSPKSVTYSQTINLTRHLTGASVLAKEFGASIRVVDVGVDADIYPCDVIDKKIRKSTSNMLYGPAMSREECVKAISIGFEYITSISNDFDIFGIGEMGIGNTTTSSAIISVLLDKRVEDVTGKGAGLLDEAYLNKIDVIRKSIDLNKPNKEDVIDVLSKVGGFDIAAMAGAFLGCAYSKKPVVIDGLISATSALCASLLSENSISYMIPSHESFEIGYKSIMDRLGIKPLFNLEMRLGEGSGCPIAFEIVRAACAVIDDMATFGEASIDDDYLEEIRKGDKFTVERK